MLLPRKIDTRLFNHGSSSVISSPTTVPRCLQNYLCDDNHTYFVSIVIGAGDVSNAS
jgi:hypothetical protein